MQTMLCFVLSVSFFISLVASGKNESTYKKPPQEIQTILDAKWLPIASVNPTRDALAFSQKTIYPPVAVLAEPMLRLGGLRINTLTNGESSYPFFASALSVKKIPDGEVKSIDLPEGVRLSSPFWNATGTFFSFTNTTPQGIELWVANAKTAKAHKIPGVKINSLLSYEQKWLPDHETLLVKMIPTKRAKAPTLEDAPIGPKIEESHGVATASSTYEVRDVLTSPHDADLFDYYTTSQLALVNTRTLKIKTIGKPAVFGAVQLSPDGQHLLIEQLVRPYSYKRTHIRFPRTVAVWALNGKVVESLPDIPLAEQVPIHGVPTGPRQYEWVKTQPTTLTWTEALDEGNLKIKVPNRDKVMMKVLGKKAQELFQTVERFEGFDFIEGGLALVHDFDENKHWSRTYLVDINGPSHELKLIDSLSDDDHYKDPGLPFYRTLDSEIKLVKRTGDWIYRAGVGSTPKGDRPFLDRLNLNSFKSERLFQSDVDHLEKVLALVDDEAGTFLTVRESPSEVPNIYLRSWDKTPDPAKSSILKPLTHFEDPMPQIRGITKQIVNYKRSDGVKLSFTLYLPSGYKPGKPLPTVFYAYPLDYADEGVASQVTGSTKNFSLFSGSSHLFFLLQGYAVLDSVAMPVVGPSEKIYDTYLEQLVLDAKAAIQKATELGVTDPKRVGIMGHSHGALMTANLLAHSDLFRAGIARSGAYNKTLTMFGFQSEKRSLFEARDVYFKVSPTLFAEKIKRPLLLIHGEIDSNPGTTPQQSRFLYEAIRGTGGNVRLVMLPFENHGYISKESTEHVLYEMTSWFDTYVKNAK